MGNVLYILHGYYMVLCITFLKTVLYTELSDYAKTRNIFGEFYGSIQYSLSAHLLGISSSCELGAHEDFIINPMIELLKM